MGRTASQILANLCAPALCALPVIWFPQFSDVLLLAAMAALAEAAADTVSSEVGQATSKQRVHDYRLSPGSDRDQRRHQRRRHVERVHRGFHRGLGQRYAGIVPWQWTPIVALAGVAGMFLDSILGATWENAGKMGNDSVNFVSTVFAADLALVAAMVVGRIGA